jgi:flagellar protein FlbD
MIPITRLDGQKIVINGDLVERVEAVPDTMISLTTGRKIMVRESMLEVVRLMTGRDTHRMPEIDRIVQLGTLLANEAA